MKSEKELLKAQVRSYYESHYEDIKEVASKFNIKERTLYHWIQTEKWSKGKLIKDIDMQNLQKKLLDSKEITSKINLSKSTIKKSMKDNMQGLYSVYEQSILDSSADELILKAMTSSFIHMQVTKTALIAQSEFNRLATISTMKDEPNPKLIPLAKDVVSMFLEIKKSLFPNQENTNINVNTILSGVISKEEIGQLSDEQIREALANMK